MSEHNYIDKVRLIVEFALERNAEDPRALGIGELSSFAEAFVVLTGRSDRQVRAIADAIQKRLKETGDPPIGIEGLSEGRWVLLDCNDVVVHVFESETRELYALERLWSDAPAIDLGPLASQATSRDGNCESESLGETVR